MRITVMKNQYGLMLIRYEVKKVPPVKHPAAAECTLIFQKMLIMDKINMAMKIHMPKIIIHNIECGSVL
jgi:hypothetical protein